MTKPVYVQEPMPWNAGLTFCGTSEPTAKEADGVVEHFRSAAVAAKQAGAAAWTFHTRQSFDLSTTSLKDRIRRNPEERALLEGATGLASVARAHDPDVLHHQQALDPR